MLATKEKNVLTLLVYLLIPLGGMSTDIYLPSLPAMTVYFHTAKVMTQLTVTSYVVGLGIFQLIAGPISDALGRRKLLLISLILQIFSVLIMLFASSINLVLVMRFIQGVGAALMLVPARAIINDIYEGAALQKQFNYLTICFALGPIVAPFLGGYLQYYFNWQANFIFTLVYAILMILGTFFYCPETLPALRAFSLEHLWKNYYYILHNRYFLICSIFIGCLWGYAAFFNVSGPFLGQVLLKLTPIEYGHMALLAGVAWFIGNVANRFLFEVNLKLKTAFGLMTSLVTVFFMAYFVFAYPENIYTLMIPTFILIMLSGMLFPIYIGEGLVLFPQLAASANACLFFFVWISFGVFTLVASLVKTQSLLPVTLIYLSLSLVNLAIYYLLNRVARSFSG